MEETIKIWKKLKVSYAKFIFSCGGDSMGDTSMEFFDKDDKEITEDINELESYFEDAVYDNVEFYDASDGHYQGESGEVRIELNEDEDNFTYEKIAQSEWSESIFSEVEISLTKEMIDFVKKNILNVNGDDSNLVVNYKRDFILTDKENELLEELKEKIQKEVCDFSPELEGENEYGELQDYYSFTSNEEGDEIEIKNNNLIINVSNNITVFKD